MSDYISRQAAIDAADRADYTGLAVEDVKKVTDEVVKELKQLPFADVAPVVHGKWERHMSFGICDKCRYEYDWKATDARNFCPNCGAKMDGGDEHETN